jgi:hypothetical protein
MACVDFVEYGAQPTKTRGYVVRSCNCTTEQTIYLTRKLNAFREKADTEGLKILRKEKFRDLYSPFNAIRVIT